MAWPSVTWGNLLTPGARQEAEQFAALLEGYLSIQHNDDGSHGDITADTITTTGAATFGGDITGESNLLIEGDATIDGSLAAGIDISAVGTINAGRILGVGDNAISGSLVVGASATADDPGTTSVQVPYAASTLNSTTYAFDAAQNVSIGTWTTGAGSARWMIVYNLSATYTVTFKHNYVAGTGTLYCSSGTDIVLSQYQGVMMVAYPGSFSRWSVFPLQVPPAIIGTKSITADNGSGVSTAILTLTGNTTTNYHGLKLGNAWVIGRTSSQEAYLASNTDLWTHTITGNAAYIALNTGGLTFITAASASAGAAFSGTARFAVAASGAVAMSFYGAGTATFDASGNITSVSDERQKDIVRPFTAGLAAVRGITPILFRYKEQTGLDTENIYAGFSAQNVRDCIPEAVGKNVDGFYSLNVVPVIAATVTAIQELSRDVDELRAAAGLSARVHTRAKADDTRVIKSRPRPKVTR
jgi:hypothetical protein